MISRLRPDPNNYSYSKAFISAGLGEKQLTMKLLEKGFREEGQEYLIVHYDFEYFLQSMIGYDPFDKIFVNPEE